MNWTTTIDRLETELRSQVCMQCDWRRGMGQAPAVAQPRACESTCAVFVHLPRLARFITRSGGEPPWGYETVIDSLLRQTRVDDSAPVASAHPEELALRTYANEVLAVCESAIVPLTAVELSPSRKDDRSVAK